MEENEKDLTSLPWADTSDKDAQPLWEHMAEPAVFHTLQLPGPGFRSLAGDHRPFEYSPINYNKGELRLIRLRHRTSADNVVVCDMEHHPNPRNYTTLSYTWEADGDQSRTNGDILINERYFTVTGNLYDFLWHQSGSKTFCDNELLWVDQLCINQNDSQEVSLTVRRMGQIYSSAFRTIIWLGTNSEEQKPYNLHWAISMIKNAPSTVKRISRSESQTYTHKAHEATNIMETGTPAHVLRRLCNLKYWGRVWIVQEVLLSKCISLQIGGLELKWEDLEHYFDLCSAYNINLQVLAEGKRQDKPRFEWYTHQFVFQSLAFGNPWIEDLISMRKKWASRRHAIVNRELEIEETTKLLTWRDVLPLTKSRACSIVRDRVFGALGLTASRVAISTGYEYEAESIKKMVLAAEMSQASRSRDYEGISWCCPVAAYTRFAFDLLNALELPIVGLDEVLVEVEQLLMLLNAGVLPPCNSRPCSVTWVRPYPVPRTC